MEASFSIEGRSFIPTDRHLGPAQIKFSEIYFFVSVYQTAALAVTIFFFRMLYINRREVFLILI